MKARNETKIMMILRKNEDGLRKHEAAKMLVDFNNKEKERKKVYEELTSMTEEMKSMRVCGSCAFRSAASKGDGLGSGTFARPPQLGRNGEKL